MQPVAVFVATIVMGNDPVPVGPDGVPERTPAAESARPPGSVLEVAYVKPPVPPEAVKVCEYRVPKAPSPRAPAAGTRLRTETV